MVMSSQEVHVALWLGDHLNYWIEFELIKKSISPAKEK